MSETPPPPYTANEDNGDTHQPAVPELTPETVYLNSDHRVHVTLGATVMPLGQMALFPDPYALLRAERDALAAEVDRLAGELERARERNAELEPPVDPRYHADGVKWVSADLYGARHEHIEELQVENAHLAAEFARVLGMLEACGQERDRLRAGIAAARREHTPMCWMQNGLTRSGLDFCICGAAAWNAPLDALLRGAPDA